MRDAMVAALSLNYFNERCERIKMANIAQTVNVLQSLILTDGEKMILTPTYHVFEMFKVHHDATMLPLHLNCGSYEMEGKELPTVSASASRDQDGKVNISIVNIDPVKAVEMIIDLRGDDFKDISGKILTTPALTAHNTFEKPEEVKPRAFNEAKVRKNMVTVTLPPASIIVLTVGH
jgi:alpha-N-arabinofuranosidase